MGKLVSVAPILIVRDVIQSANFWSEKLGFSYDRFWGEPPSFCIVHRDRMHVMLSQAPEGYEIVPHYKIVANLWNIYFWVEGVEELYREFKERDVTIDYELCIQPWGCREFGITDNNGYDVAFGEDMERG